MHVYTICTMYSVYAMRSQSDMCCIYDVCAICSQSDMCCIWCVYYLFSIGYVLYIWCVSYLFSIWYVLYMMCVLSRLLHCAMCNVMTAIVSSGTNITTTAYNYVIDLCQLVDQWPSTDICLVDNVLKRPSRTNSEETRYI